MNTIQNTQRRTGLLQAELAPLQKQFGKNQFSLKHSLGPLRIFWEIIREPMFIMLGVACALYFILGQSNEGFLMLAAILFVAAISVFQEIRSSRALAALEQLTEPSVIVIRDGKEQSIASEDLLPGDLIVIEEGSRVPADAKIVESNDFTVNESILTGESIPVEKNEKEGFNAIFQGTTINTGKCFAIVTATGNRTRLGQLGKSISTIESPRTLLQTQIAGFVKTMAIIGFSAFGLIWFLNYLHSRDIFQSLLLGLTIAMSALPEEIPVAFSSFMALGAWRMAKLGIITKQPMTIENLGAVSVICLDKTGTITENKMTVRAIYDFETGQTEYLENNHSLNHPVLLWHSRLASEMAPFDSMEKAIAEAFDGKYDEKVYPKLNMVHEYPLEGIPPMMTHVYRNGKSDLVVAKGAPERILKTCKLSGHEKHKAMLAARDMAKQGLRVLGICSTVDHTGDFPDSQDNFNWKFEGFIGLQDPPKKNVKAVFKKWYDAGIRIKLVTGDYAETSMNIANQAGIKNSDHSISGDQLMMESDESIQSISKDTNIYVRMFPEAKLKLINALKSQDEIVAMTGDGVNDGPALKSAHIGLAMGNKGTEIAKESADLIITDDNLDKITEAIFQGRKIFDNLKKAIRYIISIHIPIILTASLPLILAWKYPNIFTPIHIIFLELIMGPTCSIFYEREPVERSVMHLPPRSRNQNIFSLRELTVSFIQGLIIAGGLLSLYYYFMERDFTIESVRAIVFITLILSNVWLTFVNRSFVETFNKTILYKNSLAPLVILLSALFLIAILLIRPFRELFQLAPINLSQFTTCLVVSLICTGWFELYKALKKAFT
ncbi:MAG: haloacid dehalogenase [Bacteroidetes bacterium]|nr:MAG: haloacid dehalogenase [Bacteroidota bacterium]